MKLVGRRGQGRWRRMIRCEERPKEDGQILVDKDYFKTYPTFLIVSACNSA